MDWRVKGLVQGMLVRMPGGMSTNSWLQRTFGARRRMREHVDSKVVDDWLVHVKHLREIGFGIEGRFVVEIGTGWLPVFPLCFSLAGVARCRTYDLNRHLTAGMVRQTLLHLERHLSVIASAAGRAEDRVRERFAVLAAQGSPDAVLREAGIEYVAPADATRTGLPDRSVDLILSNSVLEHVPEPVIDGLMGEARRILGPGGVAIHAVNCGDHYAYFDRRITPIHYLRFSAREWRRWNNEILYQNRLRPLDFLDAARRAGLRVVLDRHRPRPELLERLPELPIDERFRAYPPEELCCTSIDFAVTPGEEREAGSRRAS